MRVIDVVASFAILTKFVLDFLRPMIVGHIRNTNFALVIMHPGRVQVPSGMEPVDAFEVSASLTKYSHGMLGSFINGRVDGR